jgi:hypothetical protein
MGLFRTPVPFLQNQSWQNQALNALHYNTSQIGAVIPLIYGTARQQVNLIALGMFSGPNGSGKKGGGTGTLPLTGTNTTRAGGKGGGGGKGAGKGKGAGGKKGGGNQDFMIDCDFGMCHGPIQFPNNNLVFANAGVETFNAAQAHFYDGSDGQAPDPIMNRDGNPAGYSGTCHIAFTPMDLGSTPALPNLSFELNGFLTGTGGPTFPVDANPGYVVLDFLTNPRYGAGFPLGNMTDLRPGVGLNSYGDYCQAAQFAISTSLDAQQKAGDWLDALAKLTNTAIVWSGESLKFIPYGDLTLGANGTVWTPNLVPEYSLTDHDYLPWHPHQDGAGPTPGDDDPVLVTRTNPADAVNWLEIEYTERDNYYNVTMIPVFDQSAIDLYGLRTGENLPGKAFCNATAAQISAQIYLQRLLYVRNYYKWKLGWQFCRLEPMDIVLLTDGVAGLNQQAVRITSIEEDENGDLTFEAEELSTGAAPPPPPPTPPLFMPQFVYNPFEGLYPGSPPLDSTGSISVGAPFTSPSTDAFSPLDSGAQVLLAIVLNRNPFATVSGITSSPALAWSHRSSYSDPATLLEVWWADPRGLPPGTNLNVTANFSQLADHPVFNVSVVEGPVLYAGGSPWDSNGSLPLKATGHSAVIGSPGFSTSSSNSLPIAIVGFTQTVSDPDVGGSWFATPSVFPSFDSETFMGQNCYGPGGGWPSLTVCSVHAGPHTSRAAPGPYSNVTVVPLATVRGSTAVNAGLNPWLMIADALAGN